MVQSTELEIDSPVKDLVDVPVEKNLPENYRKTTESLPDVTSEIASQAIEQEEAFSGKKEGRQRTKEQVDEVLDYIVAYGDTPKDKDLSVRMRNYYINHSRLGERKKARARENRTRKQKKSNSS